ncbi:MAG: hypothetical protein MO846_02335 [Candidatus Devosia symbiotica]|nr:hypothetical protein [Candidatus Devosia symbiotica]
MRPADQYGRRAGLVALTMLDAYGFKLYDAKKDIQGIRVEWGMATAPTARQHRNAVLGNGQSAPGTDTRQDARQEEVADSASLLFFFR